MEHESRKKVPKEVGNEKDVRIDFRNNVTVMLDEEKNKPGRVVLNPKMNSTQVCMQEPNY